jgi:hypothetical protein
MPLLKQFSEKYHSNFEGKLSQTEENAYSNIIQARHKVCHSGESSNITIEEIHKAGYIDLGNKVIQQFRDALGLKLNNEGKKLNLYVGV